MLQSLRDRTSGVVAWFIVGLLIIPFAFFGIEQFATGTADPKIATVGDKDITQSEFRNAYNQRYQRLVQMLGENFDASTLDQAAFRSGVLEDMIRQEAQLQYASEEGWRVSDQELMAFLRTVPAFQQEGTFSPQTYRDRLARQGIEPERYESQLRDGLRSEQLRTAVVSSAFTVAPELERARAVRAQQRTFEMVRVPASRFLSESEPADDAVAEAYETSKEEYRVPERVRLAYLEIDRDALAEAQPAPEEGVLRRIYEAEAASRFSEPERREVRHILTEGEDAEARIREAAQRVASGEDFAAVASEVSDDSGSAEDGGSLGWIERGEMVPAFEEAAFALPVGELSDPVESEFGWHVIRVERIDEPQTLPFEDESVQQQLERMYREREADVIFREALETVERVSFEQPASLEPAAEAAGLEVQVSDWLARGSNAGLLSNPEVAEVAFGDSLAAGENSRPLEIAPGRVLVVRQREHEESRVQPLEEVREAVASRLRRERAGARAREVAENMLQSLREGTELASLAESRELELEIAESVARDSSSWDRRVLDVAFSLPRPDQAGSNVVAELVGFGSEGFGVIALQSVTVPEAADDDVDTLRQRISGRLAGAEYAGYEQHITEAIDVERHRSVSDAETQGQQP